MLSCLCARLCSMEPTIRFGKRNMPLDCLQRIHTPSKCRLLLLDLLRLPIEVLFVVVARK